MALIMRLDDGISEKFCALVEPFDTLDGGEPDANHGLVRVAPHKTGPDLWPMNWNSIYSAVHLVPETYDVEGKPKTWLLNSTVDLQMFLTIY